jgi:hypothetical protein
MVIPYIYSTCWHIKSTFYKHEQQPRSKKKASGALVRPLTGESSKPPKYVSYSRTIKFQAQTQEVIS